MRRPASIGPGGTRRWSAARKLVVTAGGIEILALAVLAAAAFSPSETTDAIGVALVGLGLLLACVAVLAWRVPVMPRRGIAAVAAAWAAGIAVSAYLVYVSKDSARGMPWERSVQWLAVTLSFTVGSLFLRGLLRKRTTPVAARILSLVSPLAILLLILLSSRHG